MFYKENIHVTNKVTDKLTSATDFVTHRFHNHCNRIKITTSVQHVTA